MFEKLPLLPEDPILGLTVQFNNDSNPRKVDLGAGVYRDAEGETPIMAAVQEAQTRWFSQEATKAYAPAAGFPGFLESVQKLVLGAEHPVLAANRVVSVQSPGGCGALRIAAGMLSRCKDDLKIWVPTPTWPNHLPLLGESGLTLESYPYYDRTTQSLDFDSMMASLAGLSAGDVVLLHGCCHNPSGADLSHDQWQAIADLLLERGAVPFVDVAYHGLGEGLEEDAWGWRYLAERFPEMLISYSCSKNFGLYRERVGAIVVISESADVSAVCRAQLLNVARGIYSMPPSHGAAIVDIILHDAALVQSWQAELEEMRGRIAGLRNQFVAELSAAGVDGFAYIAEEKGMFSFLAVTPEHVKRLREEFSIYLVGSGRISIAGLNEHNMEYVISSLAKVL